MKLLYELFFSTTAHSIGHWSLSKPELATVLLFCLYVRVFISLFVIV